MLASAASKSASESKEYSSSLRLLAVDDVEMPLADQHISPFLRVEAVIPPSTIIECPVTKDASGSTWQADGRCPEADPRAALRAVPRIAPIGTG
jgi:hypothetical protein